MSPTWARCALLVAALLCKACAAPVKGLCPPPEGTPAVAIHLVGHGWHAGIVLERSRIPDHIWPGKGPLPDARFLEVGWGDRDFYRTPEPGLGTALKAGLLPTPSALHVVGFNAPVAAYFPYSEIIEISLSEQGFHRLWRFIADSFARDQAGRVQTLGPGLYDDSRFYRSGQTYHLFNTCNVWTARALHAAGCPITPALSVTVDGLMSRARSFGEIVH